MVYDDDDTRSWWSKDMMVAVIGSNKGLAYEIVHGLAKQGLTRVLTARDPVRGLIALQTFQAVGLDLVHFHQLDVINTDSAKKLTAWL
jgi:NAD(P)-dependent dehydrogenase (short-subunit alcohol dehydrogenase family)